jgi:hypothetical protein
MVADVTGPKTPKEWLAEWTQHIVALKGEDRLRIQIECEAAAESLLADIAGGKLPGRKTATDIAKAADLAGLPDAAEIVFPLFGLDPPKGAQRKLRAPGTPVGADEFERSEIGQIIKSERNIMLALRKSGVALSYDEFAMEYRIAGLDGYGPDFSKDAREELFLLIQREYRFKPSWDDFTMVVKSAARRNRYHPVKDYLASIEWDGIERIEEWLIAHAGAPDTPFVRAVSRIVLIAAVRRTRRPGCKFDEMLVLESPEGKNKSTAFAVLASDEWFSDDAPLNAAAREVIERIRGRWIVECADLSGMTRAEIEDLKAFLSRREDAAALKYDPETTKRKRSCIFVGTTNRTNYLISDTGNRRFWPVPIENINISTLAADRDQLWAEAAYWEAKGESIRLDPSLYDEARAEQEERRIVDPWRDRLESVLAEIEGKLICEDAWKIIDKPAGQRSPLDNNRLGSAMRDLGWIRKEVKIDGKKRWGYVRGGPPYGRIELWKEGDAFAAKIRGEDIFD